MRQITALLVAATVSALPATAFASSDDAWAEFRTSVEDACRALVGEMPGETVVLVNPFGSESYGAAIVSVTSEAGTDRMICIYEKTTGRAELTAPFTGSTGH